MPSRGLISAIAKVRRACRQSGAPLIRLPPIERDSSIGTIAALVLVAVGTAVTFWPTLDNGFLQIAFDDAIITDTAALHRPDWSSLRTLATQFIHAHYVPLTMLSLAVDHALWGLEPRGYHLGNVLLHALNAVLVWLFLRRLLVSAWTTTLAALLFAVHPLQLEAVSLAIQRKTVLSGTAFFLTLLCYQRWRDDRGRAWYAGAVAAFAAAALAKPAVVTLPLVLWLYEYTFLGRLRWLDKLPFLAIAAAATAAAVAAHAAVGAVHGVHGGGLIAHVVMTGRVSADYLVAALLPVGLSPIYYYRRALVYQPLNLLALAAVVGLAVAVIAGRRRRPWTFFCLAWLAVTLLPESNVVPLSQLRADRFLYLGMVGIALWLAVGIEALRMPRAHSAPFGAGQQVAAPVAGVLLVIGLAVATHTSAAVWRSDVTAWTRVVERYPWSATAWLLLGHAHAAAAEPQRAAAAYVVAVERDPELAGAHLALARLAHAGGDTGAADAHLHRYLALRPNDPDGINLLAAMRNGS
jgi:hypothetical protein